MITLATVGGATALLVVCVRLFDAGLQAFYHRRGVDRELHAGMHSRTK